MKKLTVTVLSIGALAASVAHAGPITEGVFSGSQTIVSMSGAGSPPVGPFTYAGLAFSESSTGSNGPGWRNLTSYGFGFTDNAGISNITIDLGAAYQKVGLDVHIGPATYTVSFFDAASALLGSDTVTLVGGDADLQFAGWQDAGGIRSINIFEISGENGKVGGFDRIQFEQSGAVPEPNSLALAAGALLALGGLRRRRA